MPSFLIALVIVFGGWFLLKNIGRSKPAKVRQLMRSVMGWGLILFGGFLTMRAGANIGLPVVTLGLGLLGQNQFFPNGFPWTPQQQQPGNAGHSSAGQKRQPQPPRRRGSMTVAEAYDVLGLPQGAGAEEVRGAHRRLMKDYHPDKGGTNYLAAKINEAKEILLQELGATT